MVRWDSAYDQVEYEANVFATNLLMPLDDYRKQIPATTKADLEMIGNCAARYGVSLIAATLRWIEYTERRAVIVISRDGFILWARSSNAAFRSGVFFKTSHTLPIPIPENSLASGLIINENQKQGIPIPAGVWFEESCIEMVVFSELYNFTISLLQITG